MTTAEKSIVVTESSDEILADKDRREAWQAHLEDTLKETFECDDVQVRYNSGAIRQRIDAVGVDEDEISTVCQRAWDAYVRDGGLDSK